MPPFKITNYALRIPRKLRKQLFNTRPDTFYSRSVRVISDRITFINYFGLQNFLQNIFQCHNTKQVFSQSIRFAVIYTIDAFNDSQMVITLNSILSNSALRK